MAKNEHSKMYETIKKWYEQGLWKDWQVENAWKKGQITEEEYYEIVGEN